MENGKRSRWRAPVEPRAGLGAPALVAGPDIIVGDLPDMVQVDPVVGSQVGLGMATIPATMAISRSTFTHSANTIIRFFRKIFIG